MLLYSCLSQNIISLKCLEEDDGYEDIIRNKCCSIYLNYVLYGNCAWVNGLYYLDLENKPIYNIDATRFKPNDLNPTYTWCCGLGHINENCMKNLHRDGLLSSFHFESIDTCESCVLGKKTKTSFTGNSERASELLGVIHTDVCGRMGCTTRGGFQYLSLIHI